MYFFKLILIYNLVALPFPKCDSFRATYLVIPSKFSFWHHVHSLYIWLPWMHLLSHLIFLTSQWYNKLFRLICILAKDVSKTTNNSSLNILSFPRMHTATVQCISLAHQIQSPFTGAVAQVPQLSHSFASTWSLLLLSWALLISFLCLTWCDAFVNVRL